MYLVIRNEEKNMELTESQKRGITTDSGNVLINSGAGAGKALVNGTKVKTPDGDVNIEELKIGSNVFGVDGLVYKVTGVYPQGKLKTWKVIFSDGSVVKCNPEHLWNYQTGHERKHGKVEYKTDTLQYIYDNVPVHKNVDVSGYRVKRKNIFLPMPKPMKYSKKELTLNPYLLGNIIHDKFDIVNSACNMTDDLDEYINYFENGHISDAFLHSDELDRLDLLRGLIDCHGKFTGSSYVYETTLKTLADDIVELSNSLGLIASIRFRGVRKPVYTVNIKCSKEINKLHISDVLEGHWREPKVYASRAISSITPSDELNEMTCISVNSPDKLFLIDRYIPTHNTSVYTARIANLIKYNKVDPSRILGLTFTNEAADNMKSKLSNIIGKGKADKVPLSTFHSFAYRTLKQNYPSEYNGKKIIQQWWKMQTVYDIIGDKTSRNLDGLGINVRAGDMMGFISYQKANMVLPGQEVIVDNNVKYIEHIDSFYLQKAYDSYCLAVKNARVIDFDDMLVDFYYKLLDDNELLDSIKDKYQYIMCDEFQDTNTVNIEILKLISDNNLFAVGDFRQGIYGFINANIDNILRFTDTFDNVELIELTNNFRSTDNIIQICNDLIYVAPVSSYKSFSEQLPSKGINGRDVSIKTYRDESVAYRDIVETINERMAERDLSYDDFCVLCRTNAELGDFESMLTESNIPVDISKSHSYFDKKDIADLLAYAQHALEPDDDMSLRRIFNSPNRYISKTIINHLDEFAFQKGFTLEQAMTRGETGNAGSRLSSLKNLFDELRDSQDLNASKFLKLIYKKTNFEEHINKKSTSYSDFEIRKESIDRLFEMSKKFSSIRMFLGHVMAIKNNSKKTENAVKLMTVHASKGLEFDTVFIPNCNDEFYPHKMNLDYEEERRLLYVAMSRAKNELYISNNVFSGGKQKTLLPSPYLIDIAKEDLDSSRKNVIGGTDKDEFSYHSNR